MENQGTKKTRSLKLEQLQKYYGDKGLVIVGLNDSQGVNTTTLFRKGLLEYLADLLTGGKIDATVINAFSLMFNKTEHIDYFLRGNLSVEDIKELQVEGMVSALEKVMEDIHMPKILGKVGYVSQVLYRKKSEDSSTFLTDSIRDASHPIIIYSCGANDLMREGWNNPFSIGKDYKNRDKNDNYKYTLTKFQNPQTVKRVLGSVERNINNILSLNENSDIYTLGIYVPKSMQKEEMAIFSEAIYRYNDGLNRLCREYGLQYVDTETNSRQYNKSKVNFHVSTAGHNALAAAIVEHIYERKFGIKETVLTPTIESSLNVFHHGLFDLLACLEIDSYSLEKQSKIAGQVGRESEVYSEKIKEVARQKQVVEKVLAKRLKRM